MGFLMASSFAYQIPPNDPNQNYNVTSNTFFLTFWSVGGIPPSFVVLVGIRWTIALFGAFLNFLLFLVSALNRNILHGTCNLLISLNALFTLLFQFSLSIGFILQLIGLHFLPLRICFLFQVLPILFRNLIISTLCAISVDRLFSVIFAIWHIRYGQTNRYRFGLSSICLAHSLIFVTISAQMANQMPELREACISSDDCYQGDQEEMLFLVNTALLILTQFCYLLIWAFIQWRSNGPELDSTKRILKSLGLTATLISVCWLSYNGIQSLLLPALSKSILPVQAAYFTFLASFLPHFGMALNGPMLFIFSKDYRIAFIKTYQWIWHQKANSTNAGIAPTAFISSNIRNGTSGQKQAQIRAGSVFIMQGANQNGRN